jgi:IS5 family transposase
LPHTRVSLPCNSCGNTRLSATLAAVANRFRELYDKGGELDLQEISRKKPILKNRTAPEIEEAVVEIAIEQPAWGQVRVSEALKRQGLSISPAGVRCVWQRHELTSVKHRAKARDPEMHQTKKGNQWYFGMKAHVGVDSRTKLIHAVVRSCRGCSPSSCRLG